MIGTQLATLCEELNGGASIGSTLLFQLINLSKALVEQRRPWMVLRNTDTSKTITAANTWQTSIDLSTITRLNRFHGEYPVRLFDGSNRIERYCQVPFEERLLHKDASGTFVYDEANKILYLNGTPTFAGTLYINHVKDSADVANTDSEQWTPFPTWAHPILGYMAVGMHKGGVDYDDINRLMSLDNRMDAERIMKALEAWDADKALAARGQYDPTERYDEGFRPGAISIHG